MAQSNAPKRKDGSVNVQDEAGFGRINKPKYCWSEKGIRPSVPCHHIREYRYAYGAVEPLTGEGCFLILPYCNTACMNLFLTQLSEQYPDDVLLVLNCVYSNLQNRCQSLVGAGIARPYKMLRILMIAVVVG